MKNRGLHLRYAVIAPLRARLQQAPLDRSAGVMPEIVMIMAIYSIQQKLDLDIFDTVRHQRGIHTRTSDSSLSTSIGLAM